MATKKGSTEYVKRNPLGDVPGWRGGMNPEHLGNESKPSGYPAKGAPPVRTDGPAQKKI